MRILGGYNNPKGMTFPQNMNGYRNFQFNEEKSEPSAAAALRFLSLTQ